MHCGEVGANARVDCIGWRREMIFTSSRLVEIRENNVQPLPTSGFNDLKAMSSVSCIGRPGGLADQWRSRDNGQASIHVSMLLAQQNYHCGLLEENA